MTNFRAQTFLGCYWAHGSTFKRSLLIIGEKKLFLNHPSVQYTVGVAQKSRIFLRTVYNIYSIAILWGGGEREGK